jgi:nucleotide-binding universal stress UspA family protein
MSEILVGIDGTASGEDALAFAQRLAASTGAGLRVATVYPYSDVHSRASNEAFRRALREDALAMLGRATAGLGDEVPRHVIADVSPPRALHHLAEETGAALLVVGSTHRGAVGRVLPGSTGERILHGASCPVAIVPHGYKAHDHDICAIGVGYDGLEESELALTSASELAHGLGARLRVIQVFDSGYDATPALVPGVSAAAVRDEAKRMQHEELAERVAALAQPAEAEAVFIDGNPGPRLAAEAAAVDLLVIGSRGYGPLRAVLLGGVAHALVRSAERPVVVLPRGVEIGLEALFAPAAGASA